MVPFVSINYIEYWEGVCLCPSVKKLMIANSLWRSENHLEEPYLFDCSLAVTYQVCILQELIMLGVKLSGYFHFSAWYVSTVT
jgi:hypothetical protein